MKIVIYLLFLVTLGITAQSQDKFIDRFSLRKSYESKSDRAQPAVFTFVKPGSKESSWLLNAAVGYNLLAHSKAVLVLDPYFEYHKNTLVSKPQDNWQSGLSTEWQSSDLSEKKWSPIFIAAVKYNNDKINDNKSFQGNIYFTPLFKGKAKKAAYFYIPNNITDFGKVFQFSYSPYIGFENEHRLHTLKDSAKGHIYRAYFRLTAEVSLFPKNEQLKDKFALNIDWQYRNNFSENVDELIKKEHTYFTAGVNYIFFRDEEGKKSASLGLDYTKGENPTVSFEQQSYYAVSLKLKL